MFLIFPFSLLPERCLEFKLFELENQIQILPELVSFVNATLRITNYILIFQRNKAEKMKIYLKGSF